jgi:hypothetical protein
VGRVRDRINKKIIQASVDVLNNGLRPHLTRWQARFRRWFDKELTNEKTFALSPQDIQRQFPKFEELSVDLLTVNHRLIAYRDKMRELVLGPLAPKNALRPSSGPESSNG